MCLDLTVTTLITTCTILAALLSLIVQTYLQTQELSKVTKIVTHMLMLEHTKSATRRVGHARVAVGFGSSVDVTVDVVEFLRKAPANWEQMEHLPADDGGGGGVGSNETNYVIRSEVDLWRCFAKFMRGEVSGRHFVANETYFKSLLDTFASNASDTRTIGGSAQNMATRFALEGNKVWLAARISENSRKSLGRPHQVAGNSTHTDEIHLIVEYKASQYWATLGDPRIVRLILHNDKQNPLLATVEDLLGSIDTYDPDLLIVSGLQAMDHYPFQEIGRREKQLIKLCQLMTSVMPTGNVHFEMDNFEELNFYKQLLSYTFPFVDSIGLNDHEIARLDRFLRHNSVAQPVVKKSTKPKLRIATTLDQMRSVFRQLRQRDDRNLASNPLSRSISRLHVHSRAFTAILVAHNSNWRNTDNAVAKAALAGFRFACKMPIINPDAAQLTMDDGFSSTAQPGVKAHRFPLNPMSPVTCWAENIVVDQGRLVRVDICVAPVLLCRQAKRTTGVGDYMSAAALTLQI